MEYLRVEALDVEANRLLPAAGWLSIFDDELLDESPLLPSCNASFSATMEMKNEVHDGLILLQPPSE